MIENIPIKNLTLLERNPRKITKEQMAKLCKSISEDPEFLNSRPVLVNSVDGKLIVYAGNQRVRAAKILKIKNIPCIVHKDLPEELVKARVIKDNKTYGEFDFDILANEWDIDLLMDSGFSPSELMGAPIVGDGKEIVEPVEPEGKESKVKVCPHCNGIL